MKVIIIILILAILSPKAFSDYSSTRTNVSYSVKHSSASEIKNLIRVPDEYYEIISKYAIEYDIPILFFIRLINKESRFDPNALNKNYNKYGGIVSYDLGIAQLNSKYIEEFEFRYKFDHIDPYDPIISLQVAAVHLRTLYRQTKDWHLAIMAYNCGLSAVQNDRIPESTFSYMRYIIYGEDV